jgi:hypothetical protein
MAKNKKVRRHKKAGMTLPLAAIAGFAPLVGSTIPQFQYHGISGAGNHIVAKLSGYNVNTHQWRWQEMQDGLIPIVAGLLIHKYIGGRLGINRMLSRAGVPFVRL